MKINLEKILVALAWPLGLIAVFSAALALFGVSLDLVIAIATGMVGLQLLISLAIDVLKLAGVVAEGTAGKWSAALNLCGLLFIAITLVVNPLFDFARLDGQIGEIVQVLSLLFGYIIQVVGSKRWHEFAVQGLGVKAFTQIKGKTRIA